MLLRDILDCDAEYGDRQIVALCHNAAEVKEGSLFFCLSGQNADGHDYAALAAKNGAAAVVCAHAVTADCPQIVVSDTRRAFALAAAAFYGHPSNDMLMFGITGTNGKTTTSYVLAEILRAGGYKVGLIGTNCIRYGDVCERATLTTPDPVQLHAALRKMRDRGITAVVMEVSAHALALEKTAGILFDAVGFTNFTQDHLDFFGTMEAYGAAKRKLFTPLAARAAAVNVDDAFGRKLLRAARIPVVSYGRDNPADVFGINLSMSAQGLQYIINIKDDIGRVKFALPGTFNMYNTLCAAALAHMAGVKLSAVLRGIRSVKRVDGRYNIINTEKFSVIIDFAHTDDGLRNIITSVRELRPKRLITVFGCGGNRDRAKRAAMGRVASDLSDFTIVTSDNPRYEEPDAIIDDILQGVPQSKHSVVLREPDRKKAIRLALSQAGEGDIVLVAGKGAETYQEIQGVKHAYNDEEYIMEVLRGAE